MLAQRSFDGSTVSTQVVQGGETPEPTFPLRSPNAGDYNVFAFNPRVDGWNCCPAPARISWILVMALRIFTSDVISGSMSDAVLRASKRRLAGK
jgi:hypothetical protein